MACKPVQGQAGVAVVRMKLTAFRDKDWIHLRDLIEVGLVDITWVARRQHLLDNPEG